MTPSVQWIISTKDRVKCWDVEAHWGILHENGRSIRETRRC